MKETLFRVIGGLFTVWFIVLLYMSTDIYNNHYSVKTIAFQLGRDLKENDILKKRNEKLQILEEKLKCLKDKQELEERKRRRQFSLGNTQKSLKPENVEGPGSDHEYLRRKIQNGLVEMWYFIKSEMNKIKNLTEDSDAVKQIGEVLEDLGDMQRSVLTDVYNLSQADGAGKWRKHEAQQLSDLIQRRLYYLQNPKDCSKARKLVCRINHGCGFGCELHHLVLCFIAAYETQRTMILESVGWNYPGEGWDKYFKPLSDTCVTGTRWFSWMWRPLNWIWESPDTFKNEQVIFLSQIDRGLNLTYARPAIPEDIAARLIRLHGHPNVWWIGQFIKYLMRPQPQLEKDMKATEQRMGFQHPIVGVHVRRTDKLKWEASFHSIDEYMVHVEEYYKLLKRRQKVDIMRVYLATDVPEVLDKARTKYPNYTFVYDKNISGTAGMQTRFTDASLRGIIMDINFLAKSDYLVCTFSSNVGRLAYEMMQTIWPDAASSFHSLDHSYYLFGQGPYTQVAIYDHNPHRSGEIQLQSGDIIHVDVSNYYSNGYSQGTNKRTGHSGLYPSYKVVAFVDVAKFPVYSEAD